MGIYREVARYYHTLRHLHYKQIYYRLYYSIRQKARNRLGYRLPPTTPAAPQEPKPFQAFLPAPVAYHKAHRFSFLNQAHLFPDQIDWDYMGHGKLWAYNLNYFEFLGQPGITEQESLALIRDFMAHAPLLGNAYEPFPTSLRCLSWIRFMMQYGTQGKSDIVNHLYRQLWHLARYREYHLMGNHLLENGFALFAGACFFQCPRLLRKSETVLREELQEQILPDGAHFERSPMYHQLMLHRILDCINIARAFSFGTATTALLELKAGHMLGWLKDITFSDGSIPLVNDSAPGIAPSTADLVAYGNKLGLQPACLQSKWNGAGYYWLRNDLFEALFDVGSIGPDYIPGHAHSDTMQVLAQLSGRPFLVDPGLSTYEKNHRRQWERSTSAHNTVQLGKEEQSEIWGGFRVARRAYATVENQEANRSLTGSHDGYRRLGARHIRKVELSGNTMTVTDKVEGANHLPRHAYWHFAPELTPSLQGNTVFTAIGKIHFTGATSIALKPYAYADGFNKLIPAVKAIVGFENQLQASIEAVN